MANATSASSDADGKAAAPEIDAPPSQPEYIIYDGACGMCHGWVKFVLRHDTASRFRCTPRQGETIQSLLSEEERDALPSSVIVLTRDGRRLAKSDASIYILRALGGRCATLGAAMAVFPRFLRDIGYQCVASVRRYISRKPDGLCPLAPPEWAARLDP